jgi:hypothetical protein
MQATTTTNEYVRERDPGMTVLFAIGMTAAIAAIGAVMMTITSSPAVKGASFLWLPAALQLVAGVWLGPWVGFLVGGIGAQLAGVIAYGGNAPVDWVQNFLAGGFANAMLPAFLFRWMKVDLTLGAQKPSDVLKWAWRMGILLVLVLAAGFATTTLPESVPTLVRYALPLAVLIIGALFLFRGLAVSGGSMAKAVFIAVLISAVSAAIGVYGANTLGGVPFPAVLLSPGIPWFAGDTVSAILGLYLLVLFTARLQIAGVAKQG